MSKVKVLRQSCAVGMTFALGALLFPTQAAAATAEPSVTDVAWYWKDAHQQEVDTPAGKVAVGTTNPFCPGAPGSLGSPGETCAEGRLPVWVRGGDYDEPYMLSAVAFDFSLVPVGSEVSRFTATFLEDRSGCEEDDSTETGRRCWSTDPINIEGKRLQACVVGDIVGSAEAAEYHLIPDHRCTNADPVAQRREVKGNDNDPVARFQWTFNLTRFAREWVSEFTVATAIIIRPFEPQNAGSQDNNWRVVLAGPQADDGVETRLVYTPGEDPFPSFTDPGGAGASFGGGDFGGGGAGDFGGGGEAGDFGGEGEVGEPEAPEGEGEAAFAFNEGATPVTMPGYVWLALLAGIIGFSLVRSVVLERAAGIRPDGALAQIQKLNAQRKGTTASAALASQPGALDAVGRFFNAAGEKLGGVVEKVKGLTGRG